MKEKLNLRRIALPMVAATTVLALSGCAREESRDQTETTSATDNEVTEGRDYGFFPGVIHGVIAPISISGEVIFNNGKGDDIVMYSPENTGKTYTIGFALGAGILLGAGSSRKD